MGPPNATQRLLINEQRILQSGRFMVKDKLRSQIFEKTMMVVMIKERFCKSINAQTSVTNPTMKFTKTTFE